MYIPQLMQLVNSGKHLAYVKPRVFLLEYARVVKEGAEVTAWDVFHCEVDVLGVLKCVEESD